MGIKYLLLIFVAVTVSAFSFMTLSRQSIRLDEAQSVWIATKPIGTLLSLTAKDVHPPLYFLMLHYWIDIFGNNLFSIRFLSFLFYLLTIPIFFQMVNKYGGSKVALITTILFCISPFVVWYSYEARMYTILIFLAVLSHSYFLGIVDSKGESGNTRFVIVTLLGLLTHYFFGFLVFCQIIYFIYLKFRTNELNLIPERVVKNLITDFFGIIIVYLPWIFYGYFLGAGGNTRPLIPAPSAFSLLNAFGLFIFGYQSVIVQSLLVALWPLSAVAVFLIFTRGKKQNIKYPDYFLIVTFMPILLAFIVSLVIPVFLPRYMIIIVPTLLLLFTASLISGDEKLFPFFTPLIILVLLFFLIIQGGSYDNSAKEDYKGVADYLSSQTKASDVISVSAPFTVYPIEYYYNGKAKIDTIPRWDRFSEGSIPEFNEQEVINQVTDYKKHYDRFFLVLSYDQGYQVSLRKYMDENYELIERRKYTEGLEVNIYKLRYDEPVLSSAIGR